MAKINFQKTTTTISAEAFFSGTSARGDRTVRIGKIDLKFTNLQKVYWPKEGYSKFDLLKYYYTISKTLLPYLKDRPLILKRYPNGITGQMFYQHNLEDAPDFMGIYESKESSG
ncbi:MAG TPA: hypothetical protein VGM92_09795, partial [Candidatus Kapabacteria bacterium]